MLYFRWLDTGFMNPIMIIIWQIPWTMAITILFKQKVAVSKILHQLQNNRRYYRLSSLLRHLVILEAIVSYINSKYTFLNFFLYRKSTFKSLIASFFIVCYLSIFDKFLTILYFLYFNTIALTDQQYFNIYIF